MKEKQEQEAFRAAIDEVYRLWNTGAVSVSAAIQLSAKKYKVKANELAKYVLKKE